MRMSSIDLYIKDRRSGQIHRIGDDPHDSLYVDHNGSVHYFNMQCGDGAGPYSQLSKDDGFEFIQSECGYPDDETVMEEAEKFRENRRKAAEKKAQLAEKGIFFIS
jgi:hypothetical protein